MFSIDILTLLAFFGAFQGIFFAVVFWVKNKHFSNKLFALLLFVTSIRIAKNIFVHFRDLNPELFSNDLIWRLLIYIGLAHQFAIGPLYMLYFSSRIKEKFAFQNRYLWHFLPYAVIIATSPFIRWNFWANGGLLASYISILLYFIIAFQRFYSKRNMLEVKTKKWLGGILIITSLMLLAYSPALFHYMGYIGGAILYTVIVISMGYILLNNGVLFSTKYETSSLKSKKASLYKSQLEELMMTEKPFLNPELTLQTLAEMLQVQPHHLSQVINQEFHKSYADYINAFRLEEAAKKLKDPKYMPLKISSLAYDSGFNSQPTFNTLFKKVYKETPSQYRNRFKK
ncbi:helix-turn-helix domain-containing protein [Flavobacteriaceae bacterium S356]|uniref:Helix-turn-helix domain-containing protein n=1 Tax=Asprobacillus argus TaxID=3076534 RepID=A0ABU3LDL1_9FLAO|nr:helix-turn-helix domain-containing protein [Flavobacteriaceae bacterium S356]